MKIHYLIPQRVNINTSDLKSSEQLVLWSLRTWVMGIIRKIDIKEDLIKAYENYSATEACHELDHFLYALTFGAKKRIDIHCPLRGSLSPDELTLLNILSCYQAGQFSLANCMLNHFCSDRYLMQARYHAIEFTRQIQEKGGIGLSHNGLTHQTSPRIPIEQLLTVTPTLAPTLAI